MAGRLIGCSVFAVYAEFAHVFAVICADDDRGVVQYAFVFQYFHNDGNLVIYVPDRGVVSIDHPPQVVHVVQPPGMPGKARIGVVVPHHDVLRGVGTDEFFVFFQ